MWKHVTKDIVDSRWVLTWKSAERRRTAKARLVVRGFQDPDLAVGLVGTPSCGILRSSHLQLLPFSPVRKWRIWSLDFNNAIAGRRILFLKKCLELAS